MSWLKSDPISVEIHGRKLVCVACGHDEFRKQEAQLNTAGMTLFNLDWLNKSATCYVCARCGHIDWFLPQ
jgi:ribosomal protein L37E